MLIGNFRTSENRYKGKEDRINNREIMGCRREWFWSSNKKKKEIKTGVGAQKAPSNLMEKPKQEYKELLIDIVNKNLIIMP